MIGLVLLLTVVGQDDLCAESFIVPTGAVSYPRALASETLAPLGLELNGQTLEAGASKQRIDAAVGKPGKVVKDWELRSEQDQCAELNDLLKAHPNSMHLYILGGLRLKRMTGAFRVVEWTVPRVGRLRVYSHKGKNGADEAFLFHLTPTPVPVSRVHPSSESPQLLLRSGHPALEWNTESNRVTVR